MFKVLLIAGSSVAFGQCFLDANGQCPSGCTLFPGTCYRNNFVNTSIGVCSTDSKICENGNNCAASSRVANAETCSTCTDSCSYYTSNTTCVNDINRAQCAWFPALCYNATPYPCTHTNKASCVAEAGCFWFSVTSTYCGASITNNNCAQCNAPAWSNSIRSGLRNIMGDTCTWPLAAPYVSAFSLKVNDVALSGSLCPAFTAPAGMTDIAAVSTAVVSGYFSAGAPFSNTSAASPTCTTSFQCAFDIENKCPMGCVETPASCYRKSSACSTDSTICETGNNCAVGPKVTKAATCSRCTDSCSSYTSNTTCLSDANQAQCAWVPSSCVNATVRPLAPCSGTNKVDCTGEAGCFWYSVTSTQCGASNTFSHCASCSSSIWSNTVRSGLKNNVGNTCTWTLAAPYLSVFSLQIDDIALSSDVSLCPAFTSADNVALGVTAQLGLFSAGPPFSVTTSLDATCGVRLSSAALFVPGLAILGVSALLA